MLELDDTFRTKTLRMSHPSSLVGLETSQAIDASGPQKAKGDCHLATPDITLNTSAPYKSLQLLLEILEQTSSFLKWQYKITTIVNISAISTFTSLQMWCTQGQHHVSDTISEMGKHIAIPRLAKDGNEHPIHRAVIVPPSSGRVHWPGLHLERSVLHWFQQDHARQNTWGWRWWW